MGLFDRAKAALGWGNGEEGDAAVSAFASKHPRKADGRPALKDLPAATSAGTLDDALAARDAGEREHARAILAVIDRGKGLRTVLRAAAALEAGDEEEVTALLPAVAGAEPSWMLALQIAAAETAAESNAPAGSGGTADSRLALPALLAFARAKAAPSWALAWVGATGSLAEARRRGMVELLFTDAPLARTVAARDWKLAGATDDREAVERYATFAHGRDAIRRFGARLVADVFARAHRTAAQGAPR